MSFPAGLDPYTSRQHLLHHTYSPLISVQATRAADELFQHTVSNHDVSLLQILKPYGNNAKYTIPNQSYKIINNQLITKNYPSFPVRFEPSLPELLSLHSAKKNTESPSDQLDQLFSISSLEILLKHSAKEGIAPKDLYLNFFDKIITSNALVPFETFNHPVSQIFIINHEFDTLDTLRKLIVEFRNYNFPKYFQIDDLLIHVFILYDTNKTPHNDILAFQNDIRSSLNAYSTGIPMTFDPNEDQTELSLIESSTIEEDLQRISLQQSSSNPSNHICVPKSIDSVLRHKLYEYVNRYLIPHMQQKLRVWDDLMLQPKKSITGRFFSASKKFFNNSEPNLASPSPSAFNYNENYYYKSSPEQTIRKLADWSLILKDFKYAYSTYDLIKKDYTNDKAWVYVASTQEMCIVSLLLAQTQQVGSSPTPPDMNTLRKIKYDIVEPYLDNLTYTFKSRLNLKTYSLKASVIVIELLLCMSVVFNIPWWWYDLIEKYLLKSMDEFETHLLTNNLKYQVTRAILYERLGYSCGKCVFLNSETRQQLNFQGWKSHEVREEKEEQEEGFYNNPNKLRPPPNIEILGYVRFRKSAMWYILSMKEWLFLKNPNQIRYLLDNIKDVYNTSEINDKWYKRDDLLLGFIQKGLGDTQAMQSE